MAGSLLCLHSLKRLPPRGVITVLPTSYWYLTSPIKGDPVSSNSAVSVLKRLLVNSNQRRLIQAMQHAFYQLHPPSAHAPILMFILQIKDGLADGNNFSRGWYQLSSKQRNISGCFLQNVSLHMYHFGLICMASRITPDHFCLKGPGAAYRCCLFGCC